jgi:hypothetical protein
MINPRRFVFDVYVFDGHIASKSYRLCSHFILRICTSPEKENKMF